MQVDSMQVDTDTAAPFQNQRGPVRPEAVLAELQRLKPDMMQPFPNEQGVLCIRLKDFYMAVCGVEETTSRRRVADLLKYHPDLYKQLVTKIPVPTGGRDMPIITLEGMMILLQRMPRSSFAQAFQQATALWNVDSMAGTADAVSYVQGNAADPSREPLRQHVANRNAAALAAPPEPVAPTHFSGGMDIVTDDELQRMKEMVAVREQGMFLQLLAPEELAWHLRYRELARLRSTATEPDEIHLLNLSILNGLRTHLNLAAIAPVDRNGMKTVQELIRADDAANLPYTNKIGCEMAKLYRDKYRRDPRKTEINAETNHSENMYADADAELFVTAKNIVLARLSRASHAPAGQTRIDWAARNAS